MYYICEKVNTDSILVMCTGLNWSEQALFNNRKILIEGERVVLVVFWQPFAVSVVLRVPEVQPHGMAGYYCRLH